MQSKETIIGEDDQFLAVIEQSSKIANLNKPVLILGERGTGKELIAQRLHFLSTRWQGPFITLNCAALNENLLDSELFGHEAGAFTGAQKRHQGRFERADGGTLFLDEIGNAPMIVQEKLLRVIEYGQLERVGGNQQLKVNVRLVCATNEDLPSEAKAGRFRADLLDRLAFDVINLPPLRERRADIMLLANHFAVSMCRELNWDFFPGFTTTAVKDLYEHTWPGNIRELKNVIERSIFRHDDNQQPINTIIINPFKPLNPMTSNHEAIYEHGTDENNQIASPTINMENESINKRKDKSDELTSERYRLPIDLKKSLDDMTQMYINKALAEAKYNQKEAAQLLNLTYDQLRGLIRKHHIKI